MSISTLKFSLWSLVLSLLFQTLLLWNKVNSVDCSTATTQTTCTAISGCTYASNKCSCDSSIDMDVVFAMDASGSIGATSFEKEKDFVAGLIESAIPTDSNISIISFASDSSVILTFAQAAQMSLAQKVAFVDAITYTRGYTDTVGAIKDTLEVFNYTTTRVKLFVLITDGNPNLPNGDIEVCNYASDLKTQGITTLIVGVGNDWDPDQVDCLVTDTTKYIISVSDFSAFDDALPAITDITCPVSYSLTITEAQIVQDGLSTGSRFIEVYNSGSAVTLTNLYLDGFFTGALTTNSSLILQQAQYLVIYDSSASSPLNCTDCTCPKTGTRCSNAIYIGCSSSNTAGCKADVDLTMTNTNWEQILIDKSDFTKIDIVNYSSKSWPTILQGYSYELKSKGYSNDDGGNWDMSCNTYGTPGADPITTCGCVVSGCNVNGDTNATCGASTCTCSETYYSSGSSCYEIPPPGPCTAQHVKNNSNEYLKYVWERASTDITHKYKLVYPSSADGETQVLISSRAKSVADDYLLALVKVNMSADIGYVQTVLGDSTSDKVYCTYVTPEPTLAPTPAPTDFPKIWIGGDICKLDRCECYNKAWDCDCADDLTRWSCTVGDIVKEFAESGNEQFITVKTWPADYVDPFTVCWTITPNGEISKSRLLLDGNDTNPSTTDSESGRADANDINIMEGCLFFNQSDEQKISIIIWDERDVTNTDANYESFTLELVNCTHPIDCDIIYPDSLLMEVEDAIYAEGLTKDDDKNDSGIPGWVWGLIAALLAVLLIVGALAYRWFVTNKKTEGKLHKTEADLEKEKEENELGFGHDLGQGDVGFNPLATGIPGTAHPSGGLASEMETRQAIVGQNVDAPSERFQHRMEYGQTLPDKRK